MNNNNDNNEYPIIQQVANGYWVAYGKGWAVSAKTESGTREKYEEREKFYEQITQRPIPEFTYPEV